MSIIRQAFKGAMWLGSFKALSQAVSWVATIYIARILAPEDYGIMEMATILTGYVVMFSELGLGAAIVQRLEVKEDELSSLFCLMVIWGLVLAIICFFLAYPTAILFKDKRLIRVTQSISVLYLIGSILIVPMSLLNRNLKFKQIGFIDAVSVAVSCIVMVIIASRGGGVWTLIGGSIVKELMRCAIIFFMSPWRPRLVLKLDCIKPYLNFGLYVAGSSSLNYIYSKSDSFFGGRILGAGNLGYYSMAQQLSSIPNGKLVSLINNVSFPIFSRYKDDHVQFNNFFLNVTKTISILVFPLYIGGYFIAEQIIPVVLGIKWAQAIFPFKIFCLSQILIAVSTPISWVNIAQGRPHWGLYIGIISFFIMPLSFYFAANMGFKALVLPWVTVDPVLRIGLMYFTLREMKISTMDYLRNMFHPLLGAVIMVIIVLLAKYMYLTEGHMLQYGEKSYLFVVILLGFIAYGTYFMLFQRSLIFKILDLKNNK
jgi:O-antigen/teichoic acid export membrane protein